MLILSNLQKIIGQHTVLEIEDFSISAGEIAAFIGPAGNGKEILFDLLVGKLAPSAGTIELAGASPAEREFSRSVGVVFLEDGLYKNLTPLENLRLHCRFYGLPRARALEVLSLVGLADQANTRIEKLPTGLLRRVAFGRAILHHPAVLLLFEPFARCDEASIGLLGSLIGHLAEAGAAVLILADNQAHLTGLCDSIYILNQGRLVEMEPPAEAQVAPTPFKIPVKLEDKVILVNPADIFFAEAQGGHTRLHTSEGCLPAQFTLGEIEERLSRSGFFRAHRSYLVNLQHVKEVIPFTRNSFSIRLDDPERTLIPLSKSAAVELRDLLGY
jgi:ABC-2 type transport system ATP-binding protein